MDGDVGARYVAVERVSVLEVMVRLSIGLIVAVVALTFFAVACNDDSSLEDLGDEVQATLVFQSTIEAVASATAAALITPEPTPDPSTVNPATAVPDDNDAPDFSGDLDVELRRMTLYGRDIDSFFNFFQVRLSTSDTVGSLGDAQGNLAPGWLEECCPSQLVNVRDSLEDGRALLDEIRGAYLQDGAAEHVALIPEVSSRLDEAESLVDSLLTAPTVDAAIFISAAARDAAFRLDEAIDLVASCCEAAPPPPATP